MLNDVAEVGMIDLGELNADNILQKITEARTTTVVAAIWQFAIKGAVPPAKLVPLQQAVSARLKELRR